MPRTLQRGSETLVFYPANEVDAFRRTWPGCDLPPGGVAFTFASNGDLVDIAGVRGGAYPYDGPDLLALSQDAQDFAFNRKGAPSPKD